MNTPRKQVKGELADALRAIAPEYGDACHRRVASELDAVRLDLPKVDCTSMQGWFKNALLPAVDPSRRKTEGGAA